MKLLYGARRVIIMTELILSIVFVCWMAIGSNPQLSGIFTVALTTIGGVGALYLGADGYVKSKIKLTEPGKNNP